MAPQIAKGLLALPLAIVCLGCLIGEFFAKTNLVAIILILVAVLGVIGLFRLSKSKDFS